MNNKAYKIWKHVAFDTEGEYLSNCCKTPKWLNYKTGLDSRLHNKNQIEKWELKVVEFYSQYDINSNVFSDLVLRVDFDYTRHTDGTAIQRQKTITRILEDWTEAEDEKVMIKYYTTPKEKEEEIQRRRSNIILTLKGKGYWTPFEAVLNDFTDSVEEKLDLFILRWWSDLRDFVLNIDWTDPTYVWIDMDLGWYTARQIFLDELDI